MDIDAEPVVISVGGKKFNTTFGVIRDTFFSGLEGGVDKDPIDSGRSNDYFEDVLQYMTDESLPVSGSLSRLLWLKREFHFYAIDLPPASKPSPVRTTFPKTTIDDLIEEEVEITKYDILRTIANEEHQQCQAKCKSGKRCRNRALDNGKCHIQGTHGDLCDADDSEAMTTLRLSDTLTVDVSPQALYHIPKRILDNLRFHYGSSSNEKDLEMLICLENVIQTYPIKIPSLVNISYHSGHVEWYNYQSDMWVQPKQVLARGEDFSSGKRYIFFKGSLYSTSDNVMKWDPTSTTGRDDRCTGWTARCPQMSVPRAFHSMAVVGSSYVLLLCRTEWKTIWFG
jgi:hypothetical protein